MRRMKRSGRHIGCREAFGKASDSRPQLSSRYTNGGPQHAVRGLDGAEVCRRARAVETTMPAYVIMLTAKSEKQDVVAGLCAGADDYITKPFNRLELHARIKVGIRIAELQKTAADRVVELELALSRVKQLQGLLPICSYCKKVRDDQNYWQQVDSYITKHSEVEFSHGICPDCYVRLVEPQMKKLKAAKLEV
ncbi:MAG: response regulator [Acidobacteriota bacterium]